jgi:fructokinase
MTKNSATNLTIGVDLGGTKIEAVLLTANGEISAKHRIATPKNDYKATLFAIGEVIEQLLLKDTHDQSVTQRLPIGIGTPGAVSLKTGLLMNCNSTCLNGKPLAEDLEALLQRPVRIANDADCFTLSEASNGAAANSNTVFGVILGTGVGGGVVFNQQLAQGVNAICGEWGHNTLPLAAYQPDDGELPAPTEQRPCFCGRQNCVETWLAGPGFEKSYQSLTGVELIAAEIISSIEVGNNEAELLLHQYCNLLSLALSNVINILDPGTIVLGGGMSNIKQLYTLLPKYLPRYVFSDQLHTRIVAAQFGDSSGVRGAAWLWSHQEVAAILAQQPPSSL